MRRAGIGGVAVALLGCASATPQPVVPPRDPVCTEADAREKERPGDPEARALRDECGWRREFRDFAEARNACTRAEECSIVAADCPLNLAVAVSWGRADEVVAKRDALTRAAAGRGGCSSSPGLDYPPTASCVDGRCELREMTLHSGW